MLLTLAHNSPQHLFPLWLLRIGSLGIFLVATVNSLVIPLPLPGTSDLLVLLVTAHRGNPWLAAFAGTLGSLVGAYVTWSAGRRGGQAMLQRHGLMQRRGSKRLLKLIERWMKRNGMLTVAIACILPPPLPLMPFLLSAGALGVPRSRYMVAVGAARAVRYGFIAWLGATYGRAMVEEWSQYLAGGAEIVIWSFAGLLVALALFGIWKYRRDAQKSQAA